MSPLTSERKDGTIPAEDEFRRILRDVIKRSGKERPVIAQAMSEALGRTVTPSMLGDFTRNARLSKKRQVRFPAAWIPALCQVTGSDRLQRHLLSERLLNLLATGEAVESMHASGMRLLEIAATLRSYQRPKKAGKKQTRKA